MTNVRRLIERLDVSGTLQPFAQATEQFGNDLERMWEESENGVGLLWLAAALGVDHHQLVAAASDLLEGVIEQVKTVSPETIQVLEAVRAWQQGEKSIDDVNQCGDDALALVAGEEPGQIALNEPWMDDVSEAASWLSKLTVANTIALDECTWEYADHLAHAVALHEGSPEEYQRAYDKAARYFAPTIRGQISSTHIQAVAPKSGLRPH